MHAPPLELARARSTSLLHLASQAHAAAERPAQWLAPAAPAFHAKACPPAVQPLRGASALVERLACATTRAPLLQVVGRPPFTGANQFQLLRCIERNEARVPEGISAQLSPPCRHLIHCLLRRNPVERLSFEEFFRHPFVATPEEAAAPLPPRAPLPAAGGIAASLAAAAAGGSGPRGGLLFSTSAPPAAAAALGAASGGSRARNGAGAGTATAPQQVLGFQQRRGIGGHLSAAQLAGQASPGSQGAAVPVGGLSHQLKPRRSLDLEKAGQGHQARQAQQAQHGQHPPTHHPAQWQPGPRRPLPVASRRLGSIQRVQGFQPALLPGQPAWAPGAVTPSSAAAAQQAAPPHPASTRPASRQQQQQQQLQAGGVAPAGGAAASHHSEDDDYVLVDPSLSAHTGETPPQGFAPWQQAPCLPLHVFTAWLGCQCRAGCCGA